MSTFSSLNIPPAPTEGSKIWCGNGSALPHSAPLLILSPKLSSDPTSQRSHGRIVM